MTSFDNNEDKIWFLFTKDDVGGSRVKSRARSYDFGSRDHGVTIAFLFAVSSNKRFNCLKSYFATR